LLDYVKRNESRFVAETQHFRVSTGEGALQSGFRLRESKNAADRMRSAAFRVGCGGRI
jgi:hypothetical protein